MSRIRSQLDTILGGSAGKANDPESVRLAAADVQRRLDQRLSSPQRQPEPAAHQPMHQAAGHGDDIQRVRDQLDRLAGKLEAALHDKPAGANRQSARQSQQAAEIGGELDRLRSDVTEIRAMLAGGAFNGELMRDVQRLGEAVSALQHPQETQNGQIATLAAEMREIRRSVDALAGAANAPVDLDMSGVARSIESGYADIASRLEETVNRNFAETRGDLISGQVADIGDQLSGLRDLLNHLPQQVDLTPLESRFAEIEHAIARLIGSGEDSLPQHLVHLEERLEEIARALIAISGNPDTTNNNLERIEARLATLSKTVDAIAETSRTGGTDTGELAGRIASVATLPDELNSMVAHIDARLDQLAGPDGDDTATLHSLAGQLETIQNQLSESGRTPAAGVASDSDALGAIEAQLSAIFARLDGLSGGEATIHGAAISADASEEIARSIDTLMHRLDAASTSDALGEDGTRLQALENQIGEIAQLLRGQRDGDIAPLADRLDSIEQQLANSRDIAIDMASQAAERAVQLAASSGTDVSGTQSDDGSDREFLEAMARDLQNIEARLAQSGDNGGATNSAVQDALGQILDRLEAIERGFSNQTGGDTGAAIPSEPARLAAGLSEAPLASSPDFLADTGEPPVFESDPEDAFGPDTAGDQRASETADVRRISDSPSLQMEQLPELEPAVDDVPLEPGSGMPDLAALVRDASQKRKSADSPPADSSADYLAAARRAAKAAASEAAASKDREDRNAKPGGKAEQERKGFGAALAKRRSLVMLVALVVLSAAMAGPLASRFLGSPQSVATVENDAPAIETVDPAATVSEAAPGETTAEAEQSALQQDEQAEASTNVPDVQTDQQAGSAGQPDTASDGQVRTVATEAPANTAATPASGQLAQPEPNEVQFSAAAALKPTAIPVPPEMIGNTALRQAAAQGNPGALFEVARRFTEGEGVDRDLSEAALWYEASASRGYAPAQYRLGNFLEKGHGVEADLPRSADWYAYAAEGGNALAMHNLAVLHSTGLLGAQPDMSVAIDWFTKAADLGVKDSQVNLGIIYAKGLGTDVDLVQSYKWFAVAAKGGDSDAASKRDMVAEAMRPDQLEKARGESELWKPGTLNVAANVAKADPAWMDAKDQQAATGQREMVAQTQRLLTKLGFDPGPADGLMGERTRDAIKRFQQETGLPVDGAITPELIQELAKDSA